MGNQWSNCTCTGKDQDFKTEFIVTEEKKRGQKSQKNSKVDIKKIPKENFTSLQSSMRGYLARKEAYYLLNQGQFPKYFTKDDSIETYDLNQKSHIAREPYRFKSGAVYTGEWKGKLRDGKGI